MERHPRREWKTPTPHSQTHGLANKHNLWWRAAIKLHTPFSKTPQWLAEVVARGPQSCPLAVQHDQVQRCLGMSLDDSDDVAGGSVQHKVMLSRKCNATCIGSDACLKVTLRPQQKRRPA